MTDTVRTTDANGYVTFVFGLDKTRDNVGNIDSRSWRYVSSFKLTASMVGNSAVEKKAIDVKFGALSLSSTDISVQNGKDPYKNKGLVLGTNDDVTTYNQEVTTYDRNGENVVYVGSQQVSNKDKDNHAVYFKLGASGFKVIMPNTESDELQDAGNINEVINFSTDKYSTYTDHTTPNMSWGKVVDTVNAAQLQYATVNFGKLRLSRYSKFRVRAYLVDNKDNPTAANGYTPIPLTDTGADVSGEKISDDFSVQIPLSVNAKGWLYVTASIESKGQVNNDVNEGFTVKSVVGVKKNTGGTGLDGKDVPLTGLSVDWKLDTEASYDLERDLNTVNPSLVTTLKSKYASAEQVTYKVPAFPRTGNAILTVYDKANQPIAYYAMPTVNDRQKDAQNNPMSDTNGDPIYRNVNVLQASGAYLISKDEALNSVGDVKTENEYAVVNSERTGVTHVIGKITSSNPNIKIDPTNDTVYTSVNWNPIPTDTASPSGSNANRELGAALVGQQISLKAQLVDNNGNPVTASGISVKFWHDTDADMTNSNAAQITAGTTMVDGASVVKVDTQTDPNGQAELVFVAGKPAQALSIYATVDSSNGKSYVLKYRLGDKDITANTYVDLYWIDANIYFEPDANSTRSVPTTYNKPSVETKAESLDIEPVVGSHWTYEVRTNGDISQEAMGSALGGMLTGYNDVTISGLTVQTTKRSDSVGDVSDITATKLGSKANVTSTKADFTNLVNVLNNDSVGKDVEFTFTKAGGKDPIPVKNVGTGSTTLDKKLTLNIKWHHDVPAARIIIPTSQKADIGVANVPVYVLVQDANGNPLPSAQVKLEDKSGKGVIALGDGTASNTTTTTANGIAAFTVAHGTLATGESSELVATVTGISGTCTNSIKWVNVGSLTKFEVEKVAYDYTAKTISLTFTNDIYADSVIKELFTVNYGTTTPAKQIVTDVAVSGKTVILSVPALTTVNADELFEVTVDLAGATKNDDTSIVYKLVSVDGQFLDVTTNTVKFKALDTRPIPQP